MSTNSKIEWTDHTFNPWWGCAKVAQGCTNCYAETLAHRYKFNVWGAKADRRFFGEKHWAEPVKWNRDAEKEGVRRRVFCGSMCDVCEERDDLIEPRRNLSILIEETPWLDWQLLTKRPQNFTRLFRRWETSGFPSNLWAGASAAIQSEIDENAEHIKRVPAKLTFWSLEPLIGPMNLHGHLAIWHDSAVPMHDGEGNYIGDDYMQQPQQLVDWVIVGGESGPGARPCEIDWIRSIVQQCKSAGVSCFVKQLGAKPLATIREITGEDDDDNIDDYEVKDSKGGDIEEFPPDLRIRQYPNPVAVG